MRAKIVAVRFESTDIKEFDRIYDVLRELYKNEAEFLEPVLMGNPLPEADAVLLPVMAVDVYTKIDRIRQAVNIPIIVITTVFGVSLMFDWESVAYLKSKGLEVYNPHSMELAKTIFKAFALKREMKKQKFLIFQDTPGDGLIPEQFKIFYWWNDECTRDIKEKFGITIVRKPYIDLCNKAKAISDEAARIEVKRWNFDNQVPYERPLLASVKLFMALRDEVDKEGNVAGCGVNCLNEAYDSDTTPCLAWNLLYQDRGVMWVCEGDTSSLMTQYLIGSTIDSAILTTNIYPFLSGMPALSHEKIQEFPRVSDPDDHALLVHCGYFGCMPQKGTSKWVLRPPVLSWLVGENSTAVDAEVDKGPLTLCKLHSTFGSIMIEKAVLEEYVQYPGSDCRNGGLIRVADGYRLMERIYSHHVIVATGKRSNQIKAVAQVFHINVDE